MEQEQFERIVRQNAELMAKAKTDQIVSQKQREWDQEKSKLIEELSKGPRGRIIVNRPIEGESFIYKSKILSGLADSEDWLITYADTITLLLSLFVILFSLSRLDYSKYEQFKYSINKDLLNKKGNTEYMELEKKLEGVLKDSKEGTKTKVRAGSQGLMIEVPNNALYDPGSAELKEEFIPTLSEILNTIKGIKNSNYTVEIEGHTDNNPINTATYPSNWELSTNRATNVVKFFINNGISANHLRAAGYADSKPKLPNNDALGNPIPQNQAENRRIMIYVKMEAPEPLNQK